MSETPAITPELIEATQVRNLIEKLKSGKALTAWENDLVTNYLRAKNTPSTSDQEPFDQSRSSLAAIWGCSPQYVSKLKKRWGGHLPKFASKEEAISWFAARKQRCAGKPAAPKKTEPDGEDYQPANPEEPFEETVIRHAEEVPVLAYALYRKAVAQGDDALVSVRIKNWGEASKQAGLIRRQFLALQEQARESVAIDDVISVLSGPLQEIISRVAKTGARCAATIAPENPETCKSVLDADADKTIEIARHFLTHTINNLREAPPNETNTKQ